MKKAVGKPAAFLFKKMRGRGGFAIKKSVL